MTNRCDSVDALMYAYYEFMRIKEENQMLEKNKDYLEMRVSSTDCAFTQNASTTISIKGFSYDTSFRLPDPGESYVIISKEKFEKLQESVVYYMALSTRAQYWKDKCERGNRLAEEVVSWKNVTGYSTPEDYMHARLNNTTPFDYTAACRIATEQLCCGRDLRNNLQADLEYYRALSSAQAKSIYCWKEATGCSTPEEAKELASANSRNNSWKAAAECNSPKELIEKLNLLRDDISGRSTVIEHYKRDIEKWQKATGCLRPEDISTESLTYKCMSLDQEVKILDVALQGWKEATGFDTPDQVKSRIEGLENAVRLTNKNMIKEIEGTIDEWQKATGCVSPGKAERKITDLYSRIDKMKEAASIASNWTDKIVEG